MSFSVASTPVAKSSQSNVPDVGMQGMSGAKFLAIFKNPQH